MAVKQLHLNDLDKTPIEPVISAGSIPSGAVTKEKLSNDIKDDINGKLSRSNTNIYGSNFIDYDERGIMLKVEPTDKSLSYRAHLEPPFGISLGKYNRDELATGMIIRDNVGISLVNNNQGIMINETQALYHDNEIATINLLEAKQDKLTSGSISGDLLANSSISQEKLDSALVNQLSNAEAAASNATKALALANENKIKLDKVNTELLVVVSDVQMVQNEVQTKQANLVSGTNIKTINGQSILGSGNLSVEGAQTSGSIYKHTVKIYFYSGTAEVNLIVYSKDNFIYTLSDLGKILSHSNIINYGSAINENGAIIIMLNLEYKYGNYFYSLFYDTVNGVLSRRDEGATSIEDSVEKWI